ncbi:MAG: glycosyltransferase [Chlorobiaceae bacterium]|nr:glycosyltransferase [Chlorobiaceae bacterium]
MNFLFLNSASSGWGGNEKSVILAAEALSGRHHVVFAYRRNEIGDHTDLLKYRLPFIFEGDLYTIAKLVEIVKKHSIDVIVPSKRKEYAIAGIVSRICGIRNVLWLGALRTPKNTLAGRLVYRTLADGIIVNARQIKEGLLKSGFIPADRIRVIYNGIDTRELDRVAPEKTRNTGRKMVITAMGRLDKNKSHDLLIRGFARFLAMMPAIEATLQILGEGAERANLEQLIRKLKLDGKVVLRGFIDNPYPELAGSDVFAMTSVSEGLSIALLEAMYLGNAPVSTLAGGGVTEIITDSVNGRLVGYGDENALADIFLKFYLEPDYRRQISEAARLSVAEKYSAACIEQQMVTFCRQTIAKQPR